MAGKHAEYNPQHDHEMTVTVNNQDFTSLNCRDCEFKHTWTTGDGEFPYYPNLNEIYDIANEHDQIVREQADNADQAR